MRLSMSSVFAGSEKWLPILRELHAQPSYIFQKVTPTMVLFPSPEELAVPMETETPPEIQAYMMRSATGDTFADVMTKVIGKALLMNVCTPFLELYPKDEEGCKQMFDPHNMLSSESIVPETSQEDLEAFLKQHMQRASPIKPFWGMNAAKIAECMIAYRTCLGRQTIPWRIVYNKGDASVVAAKITHADLDQLLLSLGQTAPYGGEKLYREESYNPCFEFGEGDYVLLDIDPETNDVKYDKDDMNNKDNLL